MAGLSSVGKRIPKIDAVDKATGRVQYIQDLKLPGMLYGKILYLSLIHISEPTRPFTLSRMPSSA